ncbi:MAG: hypothetical protein R6U78_09475 [Bacteroidales bacterium]
MLFYHPAVWSISRMIRKEREHCCDDLVLGRTDQPSTYARALLGLAEMGRPAPNLYPRSDGADADQLYKRILRILNQQHMKTDHREKFGALVLLVGCMTLVFTISGFTSAYSFGLLKEPIIPERQIVTGGMPSDTVPDTDEQRAEKMEKSLEEIELEYDSDFDMDFDIETEEIKRQVERELL